MYRFIHMRRDWSKRGLFAPPGIIVSLLILANVAVYALCAHAAGGATIPSEILLHNGAMYAAAIARHEYWRLFSYGFLHSDFLHLSTNMICLVLWGGLLERRVGACYFALIYAVALVGAAIVGSFAYPGPYLAVGASGAVSGVLGALLCLWILAKIDLTVGFFVVNIGLNVALALSFPRIDWPAHMGGFVAGIVACALLDAFERIGSALLRCKFPEFVKVNLVVAFAALAALWWLGPDLFPVNFQNDWQRLLSAVLVFFGLLKGFDVALSWKRGLVAVSIGLAAINAGVAVLIGRALVAWLASYCLQMARPLEFACATPVLSVGLLAFFLTILLYSSEIVRGFRDVGFVGASLQAERRRRKGI